MAPKDKRCYAISGKTGVRCKQYRFEDYAWCTQHLQQVQHGHLGYSTASVLASGTQPRYQRRAN